MTRVPVLAVAVPPDRTATDRTAVLAVLAQRFPVLAAAAMAAVLRRLAVHHRREMAVLEERLPMERPVVLVEQVRDQRRRVARLVQTVQAVAVVPVRHLLR